MKNKSIFLAASMNFYKNLVEIEKKLTEKGWQVEIPFSANKMKKTNDFDVSHFKNMFSPQEKGKFIQINFQNIAGCDALLVINNKKNNIDGYIGPNVLMEIGLAFYLKKKIFLLNPISKDASFKEELDALSVKIINKNLNQIRI